MTSVGIMAVDPGNTTGVAWGLFDLTYGTRREALAKRTHDGSASITGDPEAQIRAIFKLWQQFRQDLYNKLKIDPEMVIEDYILRSKLRSSGKDILIPVHIGWGLYGYRLGCVDEYERGAWGPTLPVTVIWQEPSSALALGTRRRLEDWGCWIRGRPHERDAWCHIALRLARILAQP